jgi:capsular polysaccharide transport system permease protein
MTDPRISDATPDGGHAMAAFPAPGDGPSSATTSPYVSQYRVLKALVLRNLTNEWGQSRIGYILSVAVPLLSMAVLILIFGLRGKVIQSNFSLATFVITGYPLWFAFNGMYQKVTNSASKSDSVLFFPQITQLDLIYSAAIVFFANQTVVFVLLCLADVVVLHAQVPAHPLGVLLCFWSCLWIGFALGLIICPLERTVPIVVTFINMFLRLGMWVSGVLFSVNRLPDFVQPYLTWNPILHCIEGSRSLWNPDFIAPIFDPMYIFVVGFVLTTLGLTLERFSRRYVGE